MAITKITTGVISLNAVTATIVAENVITSSELATNAVDTLQITNEAVTSAKLDTNIDVAGTLDVTGVLTADSNVVIAGNLTVNGTTVTNSATNTTIEDALIELGTGTSGTPANDAGIIIERGSAANAFIGFDESADKFIVATTTATGSSTGDLTLTAAPLVTGALTASGLSYPTSDGSSAQVIQTDGSGNLSFGTVITGGAVVHNYTATGDGSTATFDTGINPQDEVNTWVHIDGVYQNKSEYSYNGTSITFTSAPDSGAAIDIISGTQNGFSTADSVLGVYTATTTDTATYDTGLSASTENNVNIFIEGVYQPKSTYTWSGSTITFDANTPVGLSLEVIASKTLTSGAVVTASIADDAVTAAKLASNSVVSASIVNNSITGADISATTSIVASTFTGNLVGNVTGNVVGNVTGTLQTAAQGNITSVGTLTGLDVAGTPTFDGLTAEGAAVNINMLETNTTDVNTRLRLNSGDFIIQTLNDAQDAVTSRLAVDNATGDISFYEDTGSTAKFFWDASAESLGIGTTSPLAILTSKNTGSLTTNSNDGDHTGFGLFLGKDTLSANTVNTAIGFGNTSSGRKYAAIGMQTYADVDQNGLNFYIQTTASGSSAALTEAMRIDSSGTVLFKTGAFPTNQDSPFIYRIGGGSLAIGAATETGTSAHAAFYTNSLERIRIDSSGNLLVGKTANDNTTVGGSIRAGESTFTANDSRALTVGRNTNDGALIQFRKATATVGSIGSVSGTNLLIKSEDGVLFIGGDQGGAIRAINGVGSGQPRLDARDDATTDLGTGANRFKDLYLSGGVYVGGTGSANKLDDYEEGTWTPSLQRTSGGQISAVYATSPTGTYTKIGRLVHITIYAVITSVTSQGSGYAYLTGLPFSYSGYSYEQYLPMTTNTFGSTVMTAFYPSGTAAYFGTGINSTAFPPAQLSWTAGTLRISGVYRAA